MPIKGKIEIYDRRTVSGWIANFGPVSEPLLIEMLIDGRVIAQAEATGFREDVANMKFGDGHCNFAINFPAILTEGEYDRAQLRISGSDICLELPRLKHDVESDRPAENMRPSTPVFIVGSPRSGTSILVQALFRAGYHGYEEGNLLGLAKSIQDCIERYFKSNDHDQPSTLIGNVSVEELQDRFFETMQFQIDKLNPLSPWLDKTGNPETILLLPRIMKAWPSSKVIFAKRRGVENIMSRLGKFSERDFRYHCEDWVRNMKSWREVRPKLDPDRVIEIDQLDIALSPGEVSAKLAAVLNLNTAELQEMKRTFEQDRPQQSGSDSFQKRVALEETGWSEEDRKMFLDICGTEMSEFGYELS